MYITRCREREKQKHGNAEGRARYPTIDDSNQLNRGPLGDIHDIFGHDMGSIDKSTHVEHQMFVTSVVSISRDQEVGFQCRSRRASEMR